MKFTNRTFDNETVTLDYNEFDSCTFKDCTLAFHGGGFSFTGPTAMNNVRFGVFEAANRTLLFLKMLKAVMPELFEQLLANAGEPTPPATGKLN